MTILGRKQKSLATQREPRKGNMHFRVYYKKYSASEDKKRKIILIELQQDEILFKPVRENTVTG